MKLGWLCNCGTKNIKYGRKTANIRPNTKTLEVLSLLRPIVHDTSETAIIT